MTENYKEYQATNISWLKKIPKHWKIKKLKYLSKILSSNVDKHYKEEEIEVRLCNYTDVYYQDSIHSKLELMKATVTESEKQKFQLKKGDVIITKDSESYSDIAIPSIVIEDYTNIVCGYHLALIRSDKSKLISNYLYWFLCSEIGNYQFQINSNGVTRYGLPKYWIDNSIIPTPPIDEQEKICNFLEKENDRINQIIEVLGSKSAVDHSSPNSMIGLLVKYKNTLLNDVLSGKIDVQNFKIENKESL